jgi:hypothetical protein
MGLCAAGAGPLAGGVCCWDFAGARRAALASAMAHTAKIRDLDIAPPKAERPQYYLPEVVSYWQPTSPNGCRCPRLIMLLSGSVGSPSDDATTRSPPAILGASILYSRKKQPRRGGWLLKSLLVLVRIKWAGFEAATRTQVANEKINKNNARD